MTAESPHPEDMRMDMAAMAAAVLSRWLRILLVTLLLIAAAYAVLIVTPRVFESHASILVEGRDNLFTGPATPTATSTGAASVTIDSVISSQIELIKSRDTLLKVVDAVNLRSVPEFNGTGPNWMNLVFQLFGRKPEQRSIDDTVLTNLGERLTVIRERDSAIISIFVRSQSPQLAADIANAIAAEHVKRRAAHTVQDTAEASTWLEQEIVKLRQRVTEAETAVANFRTENDLFQGSNNTSLVDQQLSSIATQITDAQQRRNAAQSRAALIRRMLEAGQPIDGLGDVQNSTVIQQLGQSKADLQGQLAQRSSTLLPNHPTIRALSAQIREIERQIISEGRRVAASLEAEARIEGDLEASLQNELADLKQTATSAATQGVGLEELQREAKAQRDLLESYLLRYRDALSRSDSGSALPDVRIVTYAAPSATPAWPKTGLVLGAVAFAALVLQIGAIMFGELFSGRAVVTRQRTVIERVTPDQPPNPAIEVTRTESLRIDPGQVDSPGSVAAAAAEISGAAPVSMTGAPAVEVITRTETVAPVSEADLLVEKARQVASAQRVGEEADLAAVTAALLELGSEPGSPAETARSELMASSASREADADAQLAASEDREAAEEIAGAVDPDDDLHRPYGPAPIPPLEAGELPARSYPSALATLSADIALGRVRTVMIAGLTSADDAEPILDALVAEALHAGLSVVRVDAGTGETSSEMGLTDLAMDGATFGDVVHRRSRDGLAQVPWGRQMVLDRRSPKPRTLVEALMDIYEVVVVHTGRVGLSSTLPLFTGISCRLVLAAGGRPSADHVEAALADTAALGFPNAQVIAAPARRAEVA